LIRKRVYRAVLKTIPKGVPFVAFKENGSVAESLKVFGKRENELCSNGNREYLDDKKL
jgi:hypothetical protein